jgi:transposase
MTTQSAPRRGPGRPPRLTPEQQKTIANMLQNTDKTVAQLAKMFKCDPGHIYRTVGTKAEMVKFAAKKTMQRMPNSAETRAKNKRARKH